MPLDPQVREILDQLQGLGFPGFAGLDVAQARAIVRQLEGPPGELVVSVDDRMVPGPAGDVPVRLYRPAGDGTPPLVVFFHGGGWTIGDLETHDAMCRALANRSACAVLAVDYRLGPEQRFPAAVEDAWAATRWAAEHAAELGTEPGRLGVAGDSAGGNLAAVVSLMARDAGGPPIGHQLLIYPATDLTRDWPSYRENAEGYFLTVRDMEWFEGHYLRSTADRADWRMSPAVAADHSGLAPALVVTAEYDPLRDQGEAYGELLRAAGVPVRVVRYPGMIHGFVGMPMLDGASQALEEMGAELRSALGAAGVA
jgi:acetyl esterase